MLREGENRWCRTATNHVGGGKNRQENHRGKGEQYRKGEIAQVIIIQELLASKKKNQKGKGKEGERK